MKDLNHGTAYAILQETAEALEGTPSPSEPHALELALGVECNPKVKNYHIEDVSHICGEGSSKNAPLKLNNEEVTADYLDNNPDQLGEAWHEPVKLCA